MQLSTRALRRVLFCGAAAAAFSATAANAVTINLIDQGGVAGSQAEQGFRIAAKYWESVLTNNVTLNFGVSYAALDEGVIGSTGSSAMDFTVANWETRVNATKSSSTLDQTAILPTLSTGTAANRGAAAFYTSGPNSGTGTNGTGVNTATKIYDNDTSGTRAYNNKNLYLNTANVKAVGGTALYDAANTQKLDADITFSSTFGFDFDPTDGISANTFDFIATAIHEMGHALGFVSGVDEYDIFGHPNGPCTGSKCFSNGFNIDTFNLNTTSWFSALDMFRYSTGNTAGGPVTALDLSVGANAYFSINGGLTQVFGDSLFATGEYNGDGDQASHWKDANTCDSNLQRGIMDPTECYQQSGVVKALDLAAMDAIGWNLNQDILLNPTYSRTSSQIYRDFANQAAVPEPATWAMMIGGFGLVGGAMRRRVRVTAAIA